MNANRLLVLALAGLILAVLLCEPALAYSYTNVEWSTYYDRTISYTSTAAGTPTLYAANADTLSWQNTFVNNQPNTRICPVLWWYTDTESQNNGYSEGNALEYHYSWCPDVTGAPPMTSAGSHTLTVTHQYLFEPSWWTDLFGRLAAQNANQKSYYYVP